jgi:hypothetical protein
VLQDKEKNIQERFYQLLHEHIMSRSPDQLEKSLDQGTGVVMEDHFFLRLVHFAKLATFSQTADLLCDAVD